MRHEEQPARVENEERADEREDDSGGCSHLRMISLRSVPPSVASNIRCSARSAGTRVSSGSSISFRLGFSELVESSSERAFMYVQGVQPLMKVFYCSSIARLARRSALLPT